MLIFGHGSVRYYVLFSFCENMTCNKTCNTDKTTLFSVKCDLRF